MLNLLQDSSVSEVDLNLSAAERYAETFIEGLELVSRLAAEDTGLETQLKQQAALLQASLEHMTPIYSDCTVKSIALNMSIG